MRTPTGVERLAGNVRRIELARALRRRRCWDMQVGLGDRMRCGSSMRRKPETDNGCFSWVYTIKEA